MPDLTSAFPAHTQADWRKVAEAALKGASLDTLVVKTADDITLRPLYPRQTGARAMRGEAGAWKVLARLDHPQAGDANAQAQEDLANGADGLEVVFAGAVGAHGFGLGQWDAASLDRAFDGVAFDERARVELDLGPDGQAQAEAFAGLVTRSGANLADTRIAFGLDPLGLRARSGRVERPWSNEALRLVDTVAKLSGQGFGGPFVVADGRLIHDAGGTAAQELAFAIGAGVTYLRALGESEASAIGFRLAADADEFVTLAKFRALRLLWARVLEACSLPNLPARVHASSAWRMMSARDPYINVLRTTLAAFSAGLGGADSVALLPFSQAIGLPDAFARRLARNTQLVELRESRLGFVADPAAGAGAFEALTEALCAKAWGLFQSFEAQGGLPVALTTGEFQRTVAASAAALMRNVARLKAPITGVSAHPDLHEASIPVLPDTPTELRFEGESFAPALAPIRLTEPFERLRNSADRLPAKPIMFLAAMGPLAQHTRCVSFAHEFFAAGGIATIADPGASEASQAAARFQASGAREVCICGSDEAYRHHAAGFASALKRAGAHHVMLAGRPGENEAAWRAAGVNDFIFAGCDAVAALTEALRVAGAAV